MTTNKSKRFLRKRQVMDKTGLPESSLYAEVTGGNFPNPVKLSANRVAWLESEVDDWMDAKLAQRDKAA